MKKPMFILPATCLSYQCLVAMLFVPYCLSTVVMVCNVPSSLRTVGHGAEVMSVLLKAQQALCHVHHPLPSQAAQLCVCPWLLRVSMTD